MSSNTSVVNAIESERANSMVHMFVKLEPLCLTNEGADGRTSLALYVRELPIGIRCLIMEYLKGLIRTTARYNSVKFLDSISIVYMNGMLNRPHYVFSDQLYYDFCRGYCMKCGEPASMKLLKRHKKPIRLPKYGLSMMGLCCECLKYGFGYEAPPFTPGTNEPVYYFPNHDEKVSFNLSFAIEIHP